MFFDGGSVHPYGSFWLDFADKAIKGAAVLVGGAWTLINFERSRTFRRRLEPKVAAQIFKAGPDYFLLTTSRLKNIGQSKYPIRRRGTVVEEWNRLRPPGRKRLRVSRVFDKHGWVEPGEEIEHTLIFPVPDPSKVVAFEVSLRVVSEDETELEAIEWNASCVASAYFADGSLGGEAADKTASKASGPEVQTKEER